MGSVNYRVLRLQINQQAGRIMLPKVRALIKQEFDSRKEQLLEAFEEHPVTKELEDGPEARSNYVNTAKGGNLYSLFGFEEGTDPVGVLREILQQDIKLNISQTTKEIKGDNIIFKTPVRIPNLATISSKVAQRATVPWQPTRGFTDMLERGITGFGHYLFDSMRRFKSSRSGPAIQVDATLRSGSIGPIKYVSELLANFKALVKGK